MIESTQLYGDLVGSEHRHNYGQYFTPHEVAAFMCRWVLAGDSRNIYDPAFGLGAFYSAAKSLDSSIAFSGSDIDPVILEHFRKNGAAPASTHILCQDYLDTWGQCHSSIVCNPPYMRFQHFKNRSEVFKNFAEHLNVRLSGFTNIASAFLLKSLSELPPNGRLAYIMPLEFLNTGYGTIVKRGLLSNGALKALIRLFPEKDIFPDATTSVGIILASKDDSGAPVTFYTVRNLRELDSVLDSKPAHVAVSTDLDPSAKWLKYFEDERPTFNSSDLVPIKQYGSFSRGIATGANEFFTMSCSKAAGLGIPRSNLLPCITKSAQIRSSIFSSTDLAELEHADKQIFLLDANGEQNDAIRRYLRYGEEKSYHTRYLTKKRTPWYKLERRDPAPLLFGVFSRKRFKVIRNLSGAANLTCYHCFYPNLFGQKHVDALFLYFQSKAARTLLGLRIRHYGDGLDKFEPNDLNFASAPSPAWLSRLTDSVIQGAMDYCRTHVKIPPEVDRVFDALVGPVEQANHSYCDPNAVVPSP